MAAASGVQSAGNSVLAQMQQSEAQRTARLAEARARSLAAQADKAQTEADRAQERADTLRGESKQSDQVAGEARRSLAARSSAVQMVDQLGRWVDRVGERLQSADAASAAAASSGGVATPVVNAYGQTTGAVVNVTA